MKVLGDPGGGAEQSPEQDVKGYQSGDEVNTQVAFHGDSPFVSIR
jgi:hypothetical protein